VKSKAQVETYGISLWLPPGDVRPSTGNLDRRVGVTRRRRGAENRSAGDVGRCRRWGHRAAPVRQPAVAPDPRAHSMGGTEPEPGMKVWE
jgi:hypothetical protein